MCRPHLSRVGARPIPKNSHRVLLLFVDGVGLAPGSQDNPLAAVPTPAIDRLLGSSLTAEAVEVARGDGVLLEPLDAALGMPGLPQSATGQTALFTGVNAPAELGRHVTAFPGARLKAILAEESVLARTAARGLATTFANAYTPGYVRRIEAGEGRLSASTLAARAAGLRFRDLDDLRRGRAVAWDVERDLFAARLGEAEADLRRLDPIGAAEAGRHLAAVAGAHRLTLYETFYTDLAGHRRWGIEPAEAVRRLDGLLGGLLEDRPDDLTVVLTSDHGNLEEADHTLHTRNPVPLLAVGPAASRFAGLTRIDRVAPRILDVLGAE